MINGYILIVFNDIYQLFGVIHIIVQLRKETRCVVAYLFWIFVGSLQFCIVLKRNGIEYGRLSENQLSHSAFKE